MQLLIQTFLLCIILQSAFVNSNQKIYVATKGEVWPKPQQQVKSDDYLVIRLDIFKFKTVGQVDCSELLESTFRRYLIEGLNQPKFKTISKDEKIDTNKNNFVGYLDQLDVTISGKCPSNEIIPSLNMVENYTLTLNSSQSSLEAISFWGVLRGLESFSQLVYFESETDEFRINATEIVDWPRFPHRGLLIDTSRHFIPVPHLLTNLRAMAYNKLNVFHWHLTDDQSFPYWSKTYPELSETGAYHPVKLIYDSSDVAQVIEYARVRGIRVISEFDVPGHTRSWGKSHPELLTPCYSKKELNGLLGPMDPSKNTTFEFLAKFFEEVVTVFPDGYYHIGGDEVDFACWSSNPNIAAFMAKINITNYNELESYFIQKVVDILENLKAKILVWEEVFTNKALLPESSLVHVWRSNGSLTLDLVTKAGHYALYSSCWYLDHLATGTDWEKYYNCEPTNYITDSNQTKLLLGGEACMWTESVNEYNIISRVWPRASAAAEKLWSAYDSNQTMDMVRRRLEEHTCRMNKRGIGAQPPNGPGTCL